MNTNSTRLPPVSVALIPVVALIGAMGILILRFEQEPHLALIFATVVAALVARAQGTPWPVLEDGMLRGVQVGIKAILILVIIGVLIALWIAAGVVPYLIHLGLELLHPRFFLVAAFLICAVISLATGSSWTTAGTVGVALMGVGAGLGLSLPMVAGAVVSGSYFGDKMSPLSDTTNLASGVTGVELFTHIRHMMITTGPAFGLSLALYAGIGLFSEQLVSVSPAIESIQASLAAHYRLNVGLLIAPFAVVVLSMRRVTALPALVAASAIGGLLALFVQGRSLGELVAVGYGGFKSATGNPEVDQLLTRGGLESMMYAVSLILCALAFGGVMERARMIESLSAALLRRVRSRGGLVTATLGTCIGMNIAASDQYLSIIMPGRMYERAYRERGLAARNLSRTLEDGGTLSSPLVPWNTCGVTMTVALAVSPFAYLPYAFFNLLTPVIAAVWAYTGIGQAPLESEPPPAPAAAPAVVE